MLVLATGRCCGAQGGCRWRFAGAFGWPGRLGMFGNAAWDGEPWGKNIEKDLEKTNGFRKMICLNRKMIYIDTWGPHIYVALQQAILTWKVTFRFLEGDPDTTETYIGVEDSPHSPKTWLVI